MSPPPPRGAKKRALLTVERLKELYPAVTELAHQDPFQLVIATILSSLRASLTRLSANTLV